jgi:hypothetical protein
MLATGIRRSASPLRLAGNAQIGDLERAAVSDFCPHVTRSGIEIRDELRPGRAVRAPSGHRRGDVPNDEHESSNSSHTRVTNGWAVADTPITEDKARHDNRLRDPWTRNRPTDRPGAAIPARHPVVDAPPAAG